MHDHQDPDQGEQTRSHVVLVGTMGSGKTTLGRALAERLARPLLDSDTEIERVEGRNAARIAKDEGIEALHLRERDELLRALTTDPPAVISAAASVVSDPSCREALERATVIWLDAPVDDLIGRAAMGEHRRHLDIEVATLLAAERRAGFAEVTDLHLDARMPVPDLLATVLDHLAGPCP